jgi:hypothetical protein
MAAHRNSETGAPTKWISNRRAMTSAEVTDNTATPSLHITGGLDDIGVPEW